MTAKDLSSFISPAAGGAAEIHFLVEGIHCGGCINRVERSLKKLEGLIDARLNFTTRRLAVKFKPETLRAADIAAILERLGYQAHAFVRSDAEDSRGRHGRWLMRCLAVAGFAVMNIMLLSVAVWSDRFGDAGPETRDLFHGISALIALPAIGYAGQPFFRSALAALRGGRLNMDVPISVGVLLASGMSVFETVTHAPHAYFESALMLLFFLLCGRYLDYATREKTKLAAANIAALRPNFATRVAGGETLVVPASALKKGDHVLLVAGDRVPADGRVVEGSSKIDDSLVSGETDLRRVGTGDLLYAGTLNFEGALRLEVTAAGSSTLLDEIERLVERASAAKSRYMRLADRVSGMYAPLVHLAALSTAVGWIWAGMSVHDSIVAAIAVLIITCPCALALAVPAVQVVACGALFRNGTLLNADDAIERIALVDTIVFDKTGTLTLPEARIANEEEVDPELLTLAARLALSSRHPLAKALAVRARGLDPFPDVAEVAGQGLVARVDGIELRIGRPSFCRIEGEPAHKDGLASVIAVSYGNRRAELAIRQVLRPDALPVIARLKRQGIAIRIVSGDREAPVIDVARRLGIEDYHAAVSPVQKAKLIERWSAAGSRIMMVGDGLNDAPALASAFVSLAPVTAADVTKAQADAMFLGEKLAPVADAIDVARGARRIMRQNLLLAVVYNLIAVPLAMAGFVTPLLAAAAMSGSSLLVTLNALRAGGAARSETAPGGDRRQLVAQELPVS